MDAKDKPGSAKLTLTVEQTSQAMGLSRASTYSAIKRGDIPSITIGRRVVVPRAALYKMLGIDQLPIDTAE